MDKEKPMDRKKTTEFLGEVLKRSRLYGSMGKYWASEVSIDFGTSNVRRVDFMQFEPAGVTSIGAIEKGIFTCYEVKSCIEDVYSGNGLNFIAERNYIVTTMECYKKILEDMRPDEHCKSKFHQHLYDKFPESSDYFGIMVPVPVTRDKCDEFEKPTEIDFEPANWNLKIMMNCRPGPRKRSITEMLFLLLRSGH